MDLKHLKKEIENLSMSDGIELVKSIQKILLELLKKVEKIEVIEYNLARLLENYVCANIEGLLSKEDTQITLEHKRPRVKLENINLEIDCLGAGKIDGQPVLIVIEVKTTIRDEDINEIFKKMKDKEKKIKNHMDTVIRTAGFPEEYKNTNQIFLILATNKVNESVKIAGKKKGIWVFELYDMPSGGVAYWVDGGGW